LTTISKRTAQFGFRERNHYLNNKRKAFVKTEMNFGIMTSRERRIDQDEHSNENIQAFIKFFPINEE